MSSDYISRLRAELLRAGAAEQAPRRRARAVRRLRPVAAAAAVALVVATVVLTLPGERRDEIPAQDRATRSRSPIACRPATRPRRRRSCASA